MSSNLKRERSGDLILSIVGICAAALTLAASLYLSGAVHSALEKLQNENSVARVESLLQAVDQNTHSLADYTLGYAMWDDGYEFIKSRDPAFLEINYAESVLAVTPVQLVVIYGLDGEIIFSTALDEQSKTIAAPPSVRDLIDLEAVATLGKAGDFLGRIEWLDGRPYLLAICPITDSAGTAPIRGYLLFGSIIGEKMLARLQTLTGSKVAVGTEAVSQPGGFPVMTPDLGEAEVTIEKEDGTLKPKARAVFREDNLRQRSVVFQIELPANASRTGRQLDRLIRAVFLLVAAGFALFIGLSIREIFRRHAEIKRRILEGEEMKLAREKAESADRAKSAFLAMISHEIRTPLNAIVGYADLLRQRPGENLTERLDIICKSGGVLQHILEDILDFSKIEAGKMDIHPRPTDIRGLINEVTATFLEQAKEKGNRIESVVEADVPEFLMLDNLRVRQVLGNLVSNAVKFTEQGAIVIFSRKTGTAEDFFLEIAVEDEGIGVSPEKESILFEPFRQADSTTARRFEGTGLGLVICRRLCGLMHGTISFERRPQKGARFAFRLPSQPAEKPVSTEVPETGAAAGVAHDLSILIVDDSSVNVRLLKALLKRTGHDADTALSGAEAIERYRENLPDVIFMDIHMPGMDGLEAARRIRELEQQTGRQPCTIVAVTADLLMEDQVGSPGSGMDGFLNKPLKVAEVARTLAGIAERRKS